MRRAWLLRLASAAVLIAAGLFCNNLVSEAAQMRFADFTLGQHILDTAETRAGDWYAYGAAGPSAFDCSGLVVWAAAQHGVYIPRSTFAMLADPGPHLVRIPLSESRRGDLLFYGPGHVEFDTVYPRTSFGAQQPGSRVGWHQWGGWWQPTMALRFR
jgi:hypothetical protein